MSSYTIPGLLRNWPWKRQLSPYYVAAKRESSDWVRSLRPFSQNGQRTFDACDLSQCLLSPSSHQDLIAFCLIDLLASLTYSRRDREFVRLGCDLMNFYFVYDEYTDVSNPEVVKDLGVSVLNAMKYPFQPSDQTHLLANMIGDFWQRAKELVPADSPCLERFIDTSEEYFNAVTQEARDRQEGRARNVEDYLTLRRDACGGKSTLALIEFGLDLPEEVMQHATVQSLTRVAVELIIVVNDMHSYVREVSCGHGALNLVSAMMKEYGINRQSAFNKLGEYTDDLVAKFLSEMSHLPKWSPEVDDRLLEYIQGLGQWVRGNDDWSCESKRYYGDDGLRVREQRIVFVSSDLANYIGEDEVKKTMEVQRDVKVIQGV